MNYIYIYARLWCDADGHQHILIPCDRSNSRSTGFTRGQESRVRRLEPAVLVQSLQTIFIVQLQWHHKKNGHPNPSFHVLLVTFLAQPLLFRSTLTLLNIREMMTRACTTMASRKHQDQRESWCALTMAIRNGTSCLVVVLGLGFVCWFNNWALVWASGTVLVCCCTVCIARALDSEVGPFFCVFLFLFFLLLAIE